MASLRLPDFLIIGTMKSGTTSLHVWLGEQPDVFVPRIKEPEFFSQEDVWKRGVEWYSGLFAGAKNNQVAGEASVNYTSPGRAPIAASRIADTLPSARLICLLRHPGERLRSHYRHQLQRGRERRPFLEAISEPGNEYVAQSKYYECLEPFIQRFHREQICVVRFEDLIVGPAPAWTMILSHLGLPHRQAPLTAHNVTITKARYTKVMLWLWENGLIRRLTLAPRPIRRLGKLALMKQDSKYAERLKESRAPIPIELLQPVWDDVNRLESWLNRRKPLWPIRNERSALK